MTKDEEEYLTENSYPFRQHFRPNPVMDAKLLDGSGTVREFFVNCMIELWKKEESFSGKRPLGNSDWQGEIAMALLKAGVLKGTMNEEDDYDCDFDDNELNKLMIDALGEI